MLTSISLHHLAPFAVLPSAALPSAFVPHAEKGGDCVPYRGFGVASGEQGNQEKGDR